MAIREVGRDLDPFPALGADSLGLAFQFLHDEAVEQRRVLQPAAIVGVEQVAQDDPACRLIGLQADELRPLVGRPHRPFRQHAADLVGLLGIGALQRLPDLLLAGMVGVDGETHQLVERHAVLGVDFEQLRGHRSEAQPLADDRGRDEERRGDLLLGLALLA